MASESSTQRWRRKKLETADTFLRQLWELSSGAEPHEKGLKAIQTALSPRRIVAEIDGVAPQSDAARRSLSEEESSRWTSSQSLSEGGLSLRLHTARRKRSRFGQLRFKFKNLPAPVKVFVWVVVLQILLSQAGWITNLVWTSVEPAGCGRPPYSVTPIALALGCVSVRTFFLGLFALEAVWLEVAARLEPTQP